MNEKMFEYSLEILRTLNDFGFEAYIVGGFIRDKELGAETKIIDIATNALPEKILEIFDRTHLRENRKNSVVVEFETFKYYVQTFGMDKIKTDKRHIDKTSTTIKKDIKMRDFTINSLYLDKNMNVVDTFMGKEDIKNKIIRAVNSPKARFNKSGIRTFRAFKFAARFDFSIEAKTYKAIKNYSSNIKYVPSESIKSEITQILEEPYFKNYINLLIDSKILKQYPITEKGLKVLSFNYRKIDFDTLVVLSSIIFGRFNDEFRYEKKELELYNTSIKYIRNFENRKLTRELLLDLNETALNISLSVLKILKNEAYQKEEIMDLYNSMLFKSKADFCLTIDEINEIFNLKDGSIESDKTYSKAINACLLGQVQNNKEDIIELIKK